MQELIEFLKREMPNYAKDIKSDIGLLLSSIETTANTIKDAIPSLNKNYSKIGEYYSMSCRLKDIKEQLSEIENYFDENQEFNICEYDDELVDINTNHEKINYDDYKVDQTIPHGLFENYTYKKPIAFSLDGIRHPVRDWKHILRIMCEILNQKNPTIFESFVKDEDMQGNSRRYFAYTNERMYSGRKVSGSNVYIETNHNANGICNIIADMLEKYNIPIASVQIFLRSDYTLLHNDSLITTATENVNNEVIIEDSRPIIFIVPKSNIKLCTKCNCRTQKEIIIITYNNTKNQLSTYRCPNCEISYIADTLFKTYTKTKDLNKIDVRFIKETP